VVVRTKTGDPVVLRNEPLLDDGTPMPTMFWLCGRDEVLAVSRLEADGAVDRVEAELGIDVIDAIHVRYGTLRDSAVPRCRWHAARGEVPPRPLRALACRR